MSWFGLGLVGAILLLLWWQWRVVRRSRALEGRSAPIDGDQTGRAIYYFYSRSCGPCRAMTPRIDALAAGGRRVHKVDIETDPDLAERFQVRATPTTVLVSDGRVERVYLGSQSEQRLRAWLES